ncbi:hypothetical protein B296_00014296 [Ensete ventricosum]|uniref:Uncharacterized protein n=1 Tax=Ensete ventricosum TaxID=4639 RepID=A0A426XJT6_ENSVE|nr:hypothetical protein B296_00014296 [Ensete ventricosum]
MSASGAHRGYREFTRIAQGSSSEEDQDSSKDCWRWGFRRCSGISPEFARRFAEGIEKLARNMSGDFRKKTIGLVARIPEAVGLVGGLVFTQRRSVVDAGVPQGLGSGRRPFVPNHYKNYEFIFCFAY